MHPSCAACVWDLHKNSIPPALIQLGFGNSQAVAESAAAGFLVTKEPGNRVLVRRADGSESSLHPMVAKTSPVQAWPDAVGRYLLVEGAGSRIQAWEAKALPGQSLLPITSLLRTRFSVEEGPVQHTSIPIVNESTAVLVNAAKLLSGRLLDDAGGWRFLQIGELTSLWEVFAPGAGTAGSLASDSPPRSASSDFTDPIVSVQAGLFGPGALPVSTWHRHEAVAAEGAGDWGTAAFHWHNLAKLYPGSLEVAQRLEYSEACAAWASKAGASYPEQRHSIPPRDPRASPRQIDLTEHYNGRITHDYAVFHRGTGLRLGLQELDGITFDVRGQIGLFGAKAAAQGYILPEKVTGIAIRRRAARVHLLHTAWLG